MKAQRIISDSMLIPFSAAAIDCLWNGTDVQESFCVAGISADGSFGWVAKGGALEVFSAKNGQRLAAWCFGASTKESDTLITAVCEFSSCSRSEIVSRRLVVGTTTLNDQIPGGKICLFDVDTSNVTKVIKVPFEVTTLETIFADDPTHISANLLDEYIQSWWGIIAFGTQRGHVYLLDMCLDNETISTEQRPAQMEFLPNSSHDISAFRQRAMTIGKHLCLELNADDYRSSNEYFIFRDLNGRQLSQLKSDDVHISCLKFFKQASLLAVGFSFGSFQLWNLSSVSLEYISEYIGGLSPISHFAFQEPENDPRSVCYLWVVLGPTMAESVQSNISQMVLYQIGYRSKVWQNGVGFLYQDFINVCVRLQRVLHSDLNADMNCGSRVIACSTLVDHSFVLPSFSENDSFLDEGVCPDSSLCLIVWEEISIANNQSSSRCFLSLFDLNRWYFAQMPSSIASSLQSDGLNCSFWAMYPLDGVLQPFIPDSLLMAGIEYSEISHFVSPVLPTTEMHLQPSARNFNVCCVSESGLIFAKFLGIPQQILMDIQTKGPSILIQPNAVYLSCTKAGLILTESPVVKSVPEKREAILTLALDHGMTGFITSCIDYWSKAEYCAEGCTMRFLNEWAWKKLTDLKESVDKLCIPLYDWSSDDFTEQQKKLLRHYQTAFQNMTIIFEALFERCGDFSPQGKLEVETRLTVVRLISEYIDVVSWFLAVDLLPDCSEERIRLKGSGFPAKRLAAAYEHKRATLNSKPSSTGMLLIDALLEKEATSITQHFHKESGAKNYPPNSFYAFLTTFLLLDVDIRIKNVISLYLLKDLWLHASDETTKKEMQDRFNQYCNLFNISSSLMNFVDGVWFLDNLYFQEASLSLLEAARHNEVAPWLHKFIIRTFVCQDQCKLALKHIKEVDVPFQTLDDMKLMLTVLFANGLAKEAYNFQRANRRCSDDLMSQLMINSSQSNTIAELFSLPLRAEEEEQLFKFVQDFDRRLSNTGDLLLVYHLIRGRPIEAMCLLEKTKNLRKSVIESRDGICQMIIKGYEHILSLDQLKLVKNAYESSQHVVKRQEYVRPSPLSTAIHKQQNVNVITKSKLVGYLSDKVTELAVNTASDPTATWNAGSRSQLLATPMTKSASKTKLNITSSLIYPTLSQLYVNKTVSNIGRLLIDEEEKPVDPKLTQTRLMSAAALSLLKTPPVTIRHVSTGTKMADAPHSILSIRTKSKAVETSICDSAKISAMTESAVFLNDKRERLEDGSQIFSEVKPRTLRFMEPESIPNSPNLETSFPRRLPISDAELTTEGLLCSENIEEAAGTSYDENKMEGADDDSEVNFTLPKITKDDNCLEEMEVEELEVEEEDGAMIMEGTEERAVVDDVLEGNQEYLEEISDEEDTDTMQPSGARNHRMLDDEEHDGEEHDGYVTGNDRTTEIESTDVPEDFDVSKVMARSSVYQSEEDPENSPDRALTRGRKAEFELSASHLPVDDGTSSLSRPPLRNTSHIVEYSVRKSLEEESELISTATQANDGQPSSFIPVGTNSKSVLTNVATSESLIRSSSETKPITSAGGSSQSSRASETNTISTLNVAPFEEIDSHSIQGELAAKSSPHLSAEPIHEGSEISREGSEIKSSFSFVQKNSDKESTSTSKAMEPSEIAVSGLVTPESTVETIEESIPPNLHLENREMNLMVPLTVVITDFVEHADTNPELKSPPKSPSRSRRKSGQQPLTPTRRSVRLFFKDIYDERREDESTANQVGAASSSSPAKETSAATSSSSPVSVCGSTTPVKGTSSVETASQSSPVSVDGSVATTPVKRTSLAKAASPSARKTRNSPSKLVPERSNIESTSQVLSVITDSAAISAAEAEPRSPGRSRRKSGTQPLTPTRRSIRRLVTEEEEEAGEKLAPQPVLETSTSDATSSVSKPSSFNPKHKSPIKLLTKETNEVPLTPAQRMVRARRMERESLEKPATVEADVEKSVVKSSRKSVGRSQAKSKELEEETMEVSAIKDVPDAKEVSVISGKSSRRSVAKNSTIKKKKLKAVEDDEEVAVPACSPPKKPLFTNLQSSEDGGKLNLGSHSVDPVAMDASDSDRIEEEKSAMILGNTQHEVLKETDQSKVFYFSPPVFKAEPRASVVSKEALPESHFVFSPPLTRLHQKKRIVSTPPKLPDITTMENEEKATKPKMETKVVKRSKKSLAVVETNDTPCSVRLLSPLKDDDKTPPVAESATNKKVMKLRSKSSNLLKQKLKTRSPINWEYAKVDKKQKLRDKKK